MTSSFQTASGRGQVLGPPITDDASKDPGFGHGDGSGGEGGSGDAAPAREAMPPPRPSSTAATRPAPRRSASRTRPRYPNRIRFGETSPPFLGYTGAAMKVLARARPLSGAHEALRSPALPQDFRAFYDPWFEEVGALDSRAWRRRGGSRRHRARGLPGRAPTARRLRRCQPRWMAVPDRPPAGARFSPPQLGQAHLHEEARRGSRYSPVRCRRPERRARATGVTSGSSWPSWGRSAKSVARRSCCSRSKGGRAWRSPASRAFRSTRSRRALSRAQGLRRLAARFREAQRRMRAQP